MSSLLKKQDNYCHNKIKEIIHIFVLQHKFIEG
jgi:hypothetical protein